MKKSTSRRKKTRGSPADSAPALIAGVGASAGGLDAFIELLRHLPDDTGLAFVFLLHLNARLKSHLSEILSRATKMPVQEAADGAKVLSDTIYVMPPNVTMTMSQGRIRLGPPAAGAQAPIDTFFRSLAQDQKSRAVGIILSGMASDGTIGLEEIKAAGGITCVQDETSAGYSGMPHSAIAAGCADFVLSPKEISQELVRIGRHPLLRRPPAADDALFADAGALDDIFKLLRAATGVDFAPYKPATVRRRISRRMFLLDVGGLRDYLALLRKRPDEVWALYKEILINVTSFFRDPQVFEALKKKVFPKIIKNRGLNAPVRIWVAGCASGEEAYSIAISYLEFMRKRGGNFPAHIFATDISDEATAKARRGLYPESISSRMAPALLRRYFIKTGQGYQVSKQLRDMCVFARQDVTVDPPFANQDLISCRNLLIYLEPALQKTVLSTFHYALRPSGFLLLGGAETVGSCSDLFNVADNRMKLYTKKTARLSHLDLVAGRVTGDGAPPALRPAAPSAAAPRQSDALAVADRIALNRFAPPGVVVNGDLDILQFRGDTSRYLKLEPGKASLNLLRMAPESLRADLQVLLKKAFKAPGPVRKNSLWVRFDRHSRMIGIEAAAFSASPGQERCCLVSFLPPARPAAAAPVRSARQPRDRAFQILKRELAETKAYLQSRIEESEARSAALNVANEEVISSNEELQSTNEEIESSREELQTANEELNTLNDELRRQNAALVQLGGDLDNILESLDLPIVLMGLDLRIRRITPIKNTPLSLTPADIGRSILDIQKMLNIAGLEETAQEVIKTSAYEEVEFSDAQGRWYKLRVSPYRAAGGKVAGVVLALLDADVAKRALLQLQNVMDQSLVILDSQLRVQSANQHFHDYFHLSRRQTQGRPLRALAGGQWNDARLLAMLNETLRAGAQPRSCEMDRAFRGLGQRLLRLSAVRVPNEGRAAHTIFLTIKDITDRRRAETVRALEERERTQRQFLANVSHELRTPVTAIKGFAQTLQRGGLDDRRHRLHFVETIERHADRLALLIGDLLRLASFTRKPAPRKRRVALSPAVAKCAAAAAAGARARRISIRLDVPRALEVSADREQLREVVEKLLSNAVKFNRPGGGVLVKARAAGAEAVISVHDDGAGIARKDIPHIFERFYRERGPRSRRGAGLGLSIAQQIVIAHGGRLWAESRRGKGAAFYFSLPLFRGS